jgi:phytoene dehydrogenase-like protein
MIQRFFKPFFGGVCLDPHIRASSRVFQYVMRMFAAGDAALPAKGMEQIPLQLASDLPAHSVKTGRRAVRLSEGRLKMADGSVTHPKAVVIATEGPGVNELLGLSRTAGSKSETCFYFSADVTRRHLPYLMLNGDGTGPINNVAIPSRVSPAYAPAGKSLIAAVVLGTSAKGADDSTRQVWGQLTEWFGEEAKHWRLLSVVRIDHALPDQTPPTDDPLRTAPMIRPGVFVCGEYGSLPGIQWALLSGRRAAEAVAAYLLPTSLPKPMSKANSTRSAAKASGGWLPTLGAKTSGVRTYR